MWPAGIDDFITLMLLLSQPQKVQVLAIIILDADTVADVAGARDADSPGVNTTIKLLHLLGHRDIPVAVSTLAGVNPFPDRYRAHVFAIDVLPVLNHHNPADIAALKDRLLVRQPGQDFLAELLLQQQEPVTAVMTGPLSNLAYALDRFPAVSGKISRVWWMGGALRVPGNVYGEPSSDGSAEWNAFWDPPAVGVVFNSSVPLTLVPLDGTNKVPITLDLIYSFGPQAGHLYSALAGTLWAPAVIWESLASPTDPYCAWDTLTAACMLDGPELCAIEHGLEVAAVMSGPGQGATVLLHDSGHLASHAEGTLGQQNKQEQDAAEQQQSADGLLPSKAVAPGTAHMSVPKMVSAVVDVDPAEFKRYLLQSFQQ
eukprot:gene12058-12200_t